MKKLAPLSFIYIAHYDLVKTAAGERSSPPAASIRNSCVFRSGTNRWRTSSPRSRKR